MALDRKISLVLICLFVAFYAASYRYPPEIVAFPRFLLWIFLGLCVLLFAFPKGHPNYEFKTIISKEKVAAALMLIAYAVVFPFLGFFATTFVFAVAYMSVFNRKEWKKHIIIAVVYLTIIYFVFQKWLYVWFPEGLIM